jgi:hypothetical protein
MEKFWSDDFDMDLPKVFPQLDEWIGEQGNATVYTVGHTSFGRLNHPCVWNTHGAFLWLERPVLPRDEHGWFNINGCVDNSQIVECTWREWLRDAWSHQYGAILICPGGEEIRLPEMPWHAFERIMYKLRGWTPDRDDREARATACSWIIRCNEKLFAARKKSMRSSEEAEVSKVTEAAKKNP